MRWILIICIAVGIFFAWQNWPSLSTQAQQLVQQVSGPLSLNAGAIAMRKADGSVVQVSVPLSTESWAQRDLCGLRMSLPFQMQSVSGALPPQLPRGVQVEIYAGKSLTREIIVTHAEFPTVQALPLWIFDITANGSAQRSGLDVFPKNPATVLNGLRAQRTDCVTKAMPHVRYRMLLLERGSHVWLIETHAMENDNAFEPYFQKIAMSVQPLS